MNEQGYFEQFVGDVSIELLLSDVIGNVARLGEREIANRLYAEARWIDLPQALQQTLANAPAHVGSSGDGFIEIAIAWLRGGGRVLTSDELA